MNHYEELGISPDATEEEIRRAHRRLTKLLHPDRQTDEAIRRLAETQMRRLNGIVALLTDGEKRRDYDQQIKLRAGVPEKRVRAPKRAAVSLPRHRRIHRPWRSLPWWMTTIAGALVLTWIAVWYSADYLGSSFNQRGVTYTRSNGTGGSSGKSATLANALDEFTARLRKAFERDIPPSPPAENDFSIGDRNKPGRQDADAGDEEATGGREKKESTWNEAGTLPEDAPPDADGQPSPPHRSMAEHRAASPSMQHAEDANAESNDHPTAARNDLRIAFVPAPNIASAPAESDTIAKVLPEAVQPPPAIPFNSARSEELEGEWIYAPKKPEKRKAGLYPPDFIRLDIFRREGQLLGRYHARYLIGNRPDISPDVSFSMAQAEQDGRHFLWHSENGSRGTLKLKPVGTDAIRIEWQTTLRSDRSGLVSGVATLVRP